VPTFQTGTLPPLELPRQHFRSDSGPAWGRVARGELDASLVAVSGAGWQEVSRTSTRSEPRYPVLWAVSRARAAVEVGLVLEVASMQVSLM
jgi:hypothetical protein